MSEEPTTPTRRERTSNETAAQIERITGHLIRRAEKLKGNLTNSGGTGEMYLMEPAIKNPGSKTLFHVPTQIDRTYTALGKKPDTTTLEQFSDMGPSTRSTTITARHPSKGRTSLEGGTTFKSTLPGVEDSHKQFDLQESRSEAARIMVRVFSDELASRESVAKSAKENSSSH
jgi:hypothetical protein